MKSHVATPFYVLLISAILAMLLSPLSPVLAVSVEGIKKQNYDPETYLINLSKATYQSLLMMVEPSTGLPHDHFDARQFDITPQFAVVRQSPYLSKATGASLDSSFCTNAECVHAGDYGLSLTYQMPSGNWGSYNIDSPGFDVSQAVYLELWVRGAQGGERFEVVLWSNCGGSFPGRPDNALISVSQGWELLSIPLSDFQSYVDITSLCRLSIGFNDSISSGGTIYLDQIAFVDATGNRIAMPFDETTNVTNVGLYIVDVISALDQGLVDYPTAVSTLDKTLTSLEQLPKSHGFPHTHNHVISLQPDIVSNKEDRCRNDLTGLPAEEPNLFSTVDLGNLTAGLIILRQRIPQLAARSGALVDAMEWDWLYDGATGLIYGCRASDGSPSSWWHYNWLASDSRLAQIIGIGTGKMPASSWSNLNRDRETPRCFQSWHFEPGWDGGGLFMAFLPGIFLDESRSELGKSARQFANDQICQMKQLGAPAWGWSASVLPDGTYCGYGCLRDDVLVPHASILAFDYLNGSALMKNLQNLESLDTRPELLDGIKKIDLGFRASVNWKTGEVSSIYLFLDQSMAFLSIINKIDHGRIRKYFCQDSIIRQAKILIPDYRNSCSRFKIPPKRMPH